MNLWKLRVVAASTVHFKCHWRLTIISHYVVFHMLDLTDVILSFLIPLLISGFRLIVTINKVLSNWHVATIMHSNQVTLVLCVILLHISLMVWLQILLIIHLVILAFLLIIHLMLLGVTSVLIWLVSSVSPLHREFLLLKFFQIRSHIADLLFILKNGFVYRSIIHFIVLAVIRVLLLLSDEWLLLSMSLLGT